MIIGRLAINEAVTDKSDLELVVTRSVDFRVEDEAEGEDLTGFPGAAVDGRGDR